MSFVAQRLTKQYGANLVLNGLSLTLSPGERMALVGENGAGKSTLLQIIASRLAADSGSVIFPADQTIGYLPQETELDDLDLTLEEYVAQVVSGLKQMGERLGVLEAEMARGVGQLEDQLAEYGELQSRYEQLGGYDLAQRLEKVLAGLGLTAVGLERPLHTLSGGEKRRVALAALLLSAPQLLLLDEPTNHLDFAALAWLEGYLASYPHTLLLVSHDRHFINRVVTLIGELAPRAPEIQLYHGNYADYLSAREQAFAKRIALYAEQQAEIKRLQQLIKQQAFSRGGGKAPSDGDKLAYKARVATAERSASKSIRDAKKRLEQLEKVAIPHPKAAWQVNLHFDPLPLHSQEVIRLEGLSYLIGERPLFTDVNLIIKQGDRVVLSAPNGTGKSTLLKILMGQLTPSAGRAIIAPAATVGYLDQEQTTLDFERTALAEYASVAQGTESELRSALHRTCLFEGDVVFQLVGSLSAGQRQRLQLAKIAASRANLLLLDEPTNHLDLASLERLEESYRQFPGTLLVVSHDRWFVERVATRVWGWQASTLVEVPM